VIDQGEIRMRFVKAIDEILRKRLGGESGFAVPTVLFVVLAAFAVVSVGSLTTIGAQSGVVRDQDSKSAFVAADAGANQALLHYNRIATTANTPCLVPSTGGVLVAQKPAGWVAGTSWCPAVSGSVADGTFAYGTYSYQARPGAAGGLEIVSGGQADGVSRRIELTTKSGRTTPFSTFGVIGRDGISMAANTAINANVGTNGSITTASNALVTCSTAQVGLTGTAGGGVSCRPPTQDTLTLPPVLQGDVTTVNDNERITSGLDVRTDSSDTSWSASSRQLTLNRNSSITLGGARYSLCTLALDSNSALYIANGATVQIFFDTPEACGLSSGTAQLLMASNTRITGTSGDSPSLQMLFAGSSGTPYRTTRIELNSNSDVSNTNCEQQFVIYAPETEISIDSKSGYCGAIAGKKLTMKSNSVITSDASAPAFSLPGGVPFVVDRFVECSTVATGSPDAGC